MWYSSLHTSSTIHHSRVAMLKNSFIPVTGLTSGIDPSSPIEITADGIDDYSAIILESIHKLPQIMRGGGPGG